MSPMKISKSIVGWVAVLALGACAAPYGSEPAYTQQSNPSGTYISYGVVQSIELVNAGSGGIGGSGVGAGTIAGAVVGGILGNQVGGGSGNTAATVLGAAGGAYAGHELEKRNQQPTQAYKLSIRMNDGSYQTVTQTSNPNVRVGDRVKIQNGVATRY